MNRFNQCKLVGSWLVGMDRWNESLLMQVKLGKKERSVIKVSSRSSARALIGDTVTEINS